MGEADRTSGGPRQPELDLSLAYNSLVWTQAGNQVDFDIDRGNPSAGFRLGLPVMRAVPSTQGSRSYLYIDSSGSRTELKQVSGTREFRATDATLLSFVEGANGGTMYDAGGRRLASGRRGTEMVCTRVEDRSGNYLTATYNPQAKVHRRYPRPFGHLSLRPGG